MTLSLPVFIAVWTVMMAAMMAPSVAPLAARYGRVIEGHRFFGLASFAGGYLFVWSGTGLLAYIIMELIARTFAEDRLIPVAGAVALLAAGLYQLTPLKSRCLTVCRGPMSLLLWYSSWTGPARHFRVGVHQGVHCLGCCAFLVGLMLVFGVMNLTAMVVLAAIIAGEKLLPDGLRFSRLVGAAGLALAVAFLLFPRLSAVMP